MPGDPKECRQRAAHCIELANAAKSENDKRRMMELAATWVRLADEVREGSAMKIDGGCHCGYLRYEAEADTDRATICHCTDCQALSGSAFRTLAPVPNNTFRFLAGSPTIYVKTAESGNKREQTFCPRCGTPIYSTAFGDGPKDLWIRAGTIRQRDQFVPKLQMWARSKQRWIHDIASVRAIEKQ